ncbi:unnamed protein product [Ilex paraguariensis]|uniref:Nucleotidyltransferase-like domain-containing protein n=1 Tax=Ilex paraguariensis TaxID=185542 RepID=A0ABC8QLH3_9AQUA
MQDLQPSAARQYIDAVSTFEALEEARDEGAQVRGGMYWHAGPASSPQSSYLIRTTPAGAETSLGLRTPETEAIYERFMQRKQESAERFGRAQGRIGPAPATESCAARRQGGPAGGGAAQPSVDHRAESALSRGRNACALRRLQFATQLARVDSSMLGVLKKVDSTFRLRKSQLYTAVNKDGFEVDIIRRERVADDPHPIKLSDAEEDFWVAQARRANVLLDAPPFSAVIVASNGAMARMHTVHPATFVAFKRWMAGLREREAIKRRRDVLQADVVQALVDGVLASMSAFGYV